MNLKTEEGRTLLLDLLGEADVFIENFVPGWLDRLGLGIPMLQRQMPHLVILSASGYGQTGPLRTQRSYAPVMSALAGIEGLIGYPDGEVMGCSALALADLNCSFYGVFLIMSALRRREQTGQGTHLDLSQIEAAATLAGEAFVQQQIDGSLPTRGNADPDGTPWTLHQTRDPEGWVASASTTSDPAIPASGTNSHRPTRTELLDRLRERGVEAAPVLTPEEVADDPRFAARGFTQTVPHPHPMVDDLRVTSVPWYVDQHLPRVRGAAPLLGSDNAAVLSRFIDDETLARYEKAGVLR